MKKIIVTLLLVMISVSAFAQFQFDKSKLKPWRQSEFVFEEHYDRILGLFAGTFGLSTTFGVEYGWVRAGASIGAFDMHGNQPQFNKIKTVAVPIHLVGQVDLYKSKWFSPYIELGLGSHIYVQSWKCPFSTRVAAGIRINGVCISWGYTNQSISLPIDGVRTKVKNSDSVITLGYSF